MSHVSLTTHYSVLMTHGSVLMTHDSVLMTHDSRLTTLRLTTQDSRLACPGWYFHPFGFWPCPSLVWTGGDSLPHFFDWSEKWSWDSLDRAFMRGCAASGDRARQGAIIVALKVVSTVAIETVHKHGTPSGTPKEQLAFKLVWIPEETRHTTRKAPP